MAEYTEADYYIALDMLPRTEEQLKFCDNRISELGAAGRHKAARRYKNLRPALVVARDYHAGVLRRWESNQTQSFAYGKVGVVDAAYLCRGLYKRFPDSAFTVEVASWRQSAGKCGFLCKFGCSSKPSAATSAFPNKIYCPGSSRRAAPAFAADPKCVHGLLSSATHYGHGYGRHAD